LFSISRWTFARCAAGSNSFNYQQFRLWNYVPCGWVCKEDTGHIYLCGFERRRIWCVQSKYYMHTVTCNLFCSYLSCWNSKLSIWCSYIGWLRWAYGCTETRQTLGSGRYHSVGHEMWWTKYPRSVHEDFKVQRLDQ